MIKKIAFLCCLILLALCQSSFSKANPEYTDSEINYTLADSSDLNKVKLYTNRSLNNKEYGYTIVKDPTGIAPTPTVERFEVRSGDCAADVDWNDCRKDRERSELSEQGGAYIGRTYWYGWSIYVPNGYPNVYPTKVALGQFHQSPNARQPAWMFQNHKGGLWLNRQVASSDRYYKLIDKDDFRGKWHKIIVHAHWSQKKDGFFKLWINDELKLDFKGRTMDKNKEVVYFKYGIYRSFVSRYGGKVPTQIVYFANVKKVTNRQQELLKP